MQDLQLLGVHDDEEHLMLAGPDGERYQLPINEALYAAVRRDRAHLGQLQAGQDPARPRDIQAKIRAGLTAEEVATGAGVPLEQVRRYEGPVLAERAHIAQLAGRVLVYSKQDPAADGRPLAELAAERLRLRDVDLETANWDAWRRPDSRWYVELTFAAAGKSRTASWTFDRGSLTPEDDEARWLTDSGPIDSGPLPPRRLAAVSDDAVPDPPEQTNADEANDRSNDTDRLLDTLGALRGRRTPVDPTVDETDPYRGILDGGANSDSIPEPNGTSHLATAIDPDDDSARPRKAQPHKTQPHKTQPHEAEQPSQHGDSDATVWPLGAHTAASKPEDADSPDVLASEPAATGQSAGAGTDERGNESGHTGRAGGKKPGKGSGEGAGVGSGSRADKRSGAAAEPARDGQVPGQQSLLDDDSLTPPTGKRGKRHSVPSWDEIMFGAKRD